jgi:hypothetical protein
MKNPLKIGIGLTVFNRNETAYQTIEQIKKHLAKGAKFVIVDDGSDEPIKGSNFRFETNQGISYAKNKCLELLKDCEHIFLFDDDCFPVVDNWHLPYISSGIKHLSFTFDKLKDGRLNNNRFLGMRNGLKEYFNPCGCMLYIHHDCLDVVGGFDTDYVVYSFEHLDFSNRVFNAGLTPYRFLDVANSLDLFRSLDYEMKVSSSVKERPIYFDINRKRLSVYNRSKEFKPYILDRKKLIEKAVFCSYFNYKNDPQRHLKWNSDVSKIQKLVDICKNHKVTLFVFHDCFENVVDSKYCKFIKVEPNKNFVPNVYRYLVYRKFLDKNEIDKVFFVDSTDVEMLKNPFNEIDQNKIYVGYEFDKKVSNYWMQSTQERYVRHVPEYSNTVRAFRAYPLLNCGIIGGSYHIMKRFIDLMASYHELFTAGVNASTDMAIFNFVMFRFFNGRFIYGDKINTRFKKEEYNNISWFKHK